MNIWTKEIEINAPINHVWKYFDGTLEDMQKIMPQVDKNEPVNVTENKVGSVFRRAYREGKRVQEYDVETLEYENTPDLKKLKIGFTLARMFEITAYYELKKVNETTTTLLYTATNRPLRFFSKMLLLFGNDQVVIEFVERVKRVAEEELAVSEV